MPQIPSGPSGTLGRRSAEHELSRAQSRPELLHALAGLQAGVMGALLIVACLMIGSLWNGRSIWVVPNLFATTFFGSEVYRNQVLRTSMDRYCADCRRIRQLLGVVWGYAYWRDQRKRWLGFYGAVAGLCVYFFLYDFLVRHVNPLITLYAPDRQLQLGHLLWGIVLARSPLFARHIADSTSANSSAISDGDLSGNLSNIASGS